MGMTLYVITHNQTPSFTYYSGNTEKALGWLSKRKNITIYTEPSEEAEYLLGNKLMTGAEYTVIVMQPGEVHTLESTFNNFFLVPDINRLTLRKVRYSGMWTDANKYQVSLINLSR